MGLLRKGIVLAGGQSQRFGEDKALAEFSGVKLIERPVRLLEEVGLEAVVIANSERDYSFLGCRIENDTVLYQGPQGGLATAFRLFPDEALLVLSCDMPNLTKEVLQALLNAWQKKHSVVLYESQVDRLQPFPGIYDATALRSIPGTFTTNDRSMQNFLKHVPSIHFVAKPKNAESIFQNINRRQDLPE